VCPVVLASSEAARKCFPNLPEEVAVTFLLNNKGPANDAANCIYAHTALPISPQPFFASS
jgi:hypothetical protein